MNDKPANELLQILTASLKEYFKSATNEEIVAGFKTQLKLILDLEAKLFKKVNEAIGELQEKESKRGEVQKEISVKLEDKINRKLTQIRDGKDGIDGNDADEEKIVKNILSKIPEPVKETAKDIREKLESLKGEDRLDKEAIRGLEEELNALKEELVKEKRFVGGGGGSVNARGLIKALDISSSLDGITTTFNIQAVWKVIDIKLSSKPVLRETIDWTWTPTSVTFTSEINASTDLAAGQSCILIIAEA